MDIFLSCLQMGEIQTYYEEGALAEVLFHQRQLIDEILREQTFGFKLAVTGNGWKYCSCAFADYDGLYI